MKPTVKITDDPFMLTVLIVIVILISLFIIYPLATVIFKSLSSEGGLTLRRYVDLLTTHRDRTPLTNSLVLGFCTALCGTIVGFLYAFALTKVRLPFSGFFYYICLFPIISPPFVIALSGIMLFGHSGVINKGLLGGMGGFEIYGLPGLVIVETITYYPTAFLVLYGLLKSMNPHLEESAMDLGASKWRIFRTVTIPLAIPGLASSFLLIFAQSLADFGNPMVIGGDFRVLAVEAYFRVTGTMMDLSGGAALAVILLIPSLIAYLLQRYWVSRRSYVTVTGKPPSGSNVMETPFTRCLGLIYCLTISSIIALFYGVVLLGAFVKVWGRDNALTLRHFKYIFSRNNLQCILDTVALSAIATPMIGILSVFIAYLVVRRRFIGKGALDFSTMLTFALPGTVVGIGYVLAYNKSPLLLTGSAAILIICFVFRFIPLGFRSAAAQLMQIDPSIEEASIDLGASTQRTFFSITLPMIKPAIFSGLAFAFVRCMTALSAVIFLVSARYNLVTVAILAEVEASNYSAASAYSLVIIAVVLAVLIALMKLVSRIGRGSAEDMLTAA